MKPRGSHTAAVHRPTQPPRPPEPPSRTPLTTEGRRLLEQRVTLLTSTVAELGEALDDPERRADMVEGYQRATAELARLQTLLAESESLDDRPDDPLTVDIGDRVSIRLDDGTDEAYFVVHEEEAVVDDDRISVNSPLGQALIDQHVGDTVEVTVPGGSYRCSILRATRRDAPGNHSEGAK